MTVSMTDRQWDDLRALFEELDGAWNVTEDGRDVGDWTLQERYDRLHQACVASKNVELLLDEIEATR
jgi:hypothetical protein